MKVTVIQQHKSNYPNPIHFKEGESLFIEKEDNEYPSWVPIKTVLRS